MARVIQVFEFEKLTIHEDSRGRSLEKNELKKLYEFNDTNNNNYYSIFR